MIRNCPKCGYARKASDTKVPDWQCPSCGIAYQKFIDQPNAVAQPSRAPSVGPTPQPLSSMSATALFFILAGTLAVGYAVYKKVYGPPQPDSAPGFAQSAAPGPGADGRPPVLAMSPEASAGLAQLAPTKVVLFGTSWCPNCAQVRNLLSSQGVRYTELDVEQDPRAAAFQRENMPVIGFPVTVIGSRIVMGHDEGQILASLKAL
jgi:glutaredoxin